MAESSPRLPATPYPDLHALASASAWLDEMPGLKAATLRWQSDLDGIRARRRREAQRLSRPRPDPRIAARAAQVGSEITLATAKLGAEAARRGTTPGRAELAQATRRLFERLGPTYVKLGQLISSASGLVPDDVIAEFARLRDSVPPDPAATAIRQVEQALGPLAHHFREFDPTPLASASIAQVHPATLRDGRRVVVKVRHPGVRRRFLDDLAIMSWQAFVVDRFADLGILNPSGLIDLYAHQVVEELDFRLEALNLAEAGVIAEDAGRSSEWVVPRPVPELVRERVLVMERLDGIGYDDLAALAAAGVDTATLIGQAVHAVVESTLVYGRFHGDMHAGNLMALPRPGGQPPALGVVDFGIVGRLSETERLALLRFVTAVMAGDVPGQLEALVDFGAFDQPIDVAEVAAAIEQRGRAAGDALLARSETVSLDDLADAIAQVVAELQRFGFRVPPAVVLFAKNLIYLAGSVTRLAPDADAGIMFAPVAFTFLSAQMRYLGTSPEELFSRLLADPDLPPGFGFGTGPGLDPGPDRPAGPGWSGLV